MGNWTNNMKHFLIITNAFKDKNLKLTNEIKGSKEPGEDYFKMYTEESYVSVSELRRAFA